LYKCNLCGADEFDYLFTKRGWQLVACRSCGLIRVDPMPRPEQIAELYAPTSGYQLHRLGGITRYTRWEERRTDLLATIVGRAPHPRARLLDVGCATGTFLLKARSNNWHVQGIEIAKHLAVFARLKHGLEVEVCGAEEVVDRFGTGSFDVITLWDVVEHLRQPLQAMCNICRALKPGGRLFVATPNVNGWVSQFHFRVLKPLWGIWSHPEPPLHLYQFSRRTVRRLFESAGLESLHFIYDKIPLWYTSGFLGEPQLAEWVHGEPGVPRARLIYLLTAPVFLAASVARRGDSVIICGTRPSRQPD
jgi:2-polyprenyl-3-methyl-5-hydroxy-6-metoxy-1,4-benzoquinol methylase